MKANLKYFRDDFRTTTWLLFGACLHAGLLIFLPPRVAAAAPVAILLSRFVYFLLLRQGILHNPVTKDVRYGRWSTHIPQPDGSRSKDPSGQEMVVFILGFRSTQ
jgi:hypothetical protein